MNSARRWALVAMLTVCGGCSALAEDAKAEQVVKDQVEPIVLGLAPVPTGEDLEAMRLLMQTWQMRIDSKLPRKP